MYVCMYVCIIIHVRINTYEESIRGVLANLLNCDIVVNELELKMLFCIHFRTNTPWRKV